MSKKRHTNPQTELFLPESSQAGLPPALAADTSAGAQAKAQETSKDLPPPQTAADNKEASPPDRSLETESPAKGTALDGKPVRSKRPQEKKTTPSVDSQSTVREEPAPSPGSPDKNLAEAPAPDAANGSATAAASPQEPVLRNEAAPADTNTSKELGAEPKPSKHQRRRAAMKEKKLVNFSCGIQEDIYAAMKKEAKERHVSVAIVVREVLREKYPKAPMKLRAKRTTPEQKQEENHEAAA